MGGGDWPQFGRDVTNSRHQQGEGTIGVKQAVKLIPAWSYHTPGDSELPYGALQSTPIIAYGCAYIGSANGDITALNRPYAVVLEGRWIDEAELKSLRRAQ